MSQWDLVFARPNVEIQQIVSTETIKICTEDDRDLQAIIQKHEKAGKFIKAFRDEFSVRRKPSFVLTSADLPEHLIRQPDPITSLRDIVSISATTKGLSNVLVNGSRGQILYSDAFDFYPWNLTTDYEHVVAITPAVVALHDVHKLRPQSTPSFPHFVVDKSKIDEPLLEALLGRWNERYLSRRPTWENIALFRSLNMAINASKMPGFRTVTMYDVGRLVALWVSAFEILVHPKVARSNFWRVRDYLIDMRWKSAKVSKKYYRIAQRHKKSFTSANTPTWVCRKLYDLRNAFLHGNRIKEQDLISNKTKKYYHSYAPIIYRILLQRALDLDKFDLEFSGDISKDLSVHYRKWWAKRYHQNLFEDAIMTIRAPMADED